MPELPLPVQNLEYKDTISGLQFGFAQVKDTAPDRPLQDEKDESMVPRFCYILESLGGRLNIPLPFHPVALQLGCLRVGAKNPYILK